MVSKGLCPAVFLDRDGVINRPFVRNGKSYAPRTLEDFILLPNSKRSISLLKQSGFKVIVVTNQPDIGNGFVNAEIVEAMHQRLFKRMSIDDIFLCAHRQDEGCNCRKPKAGMLFEAAAKHSIDLKKSFMVGDRTSDVEAGKRAGCTSVFIDRNYNEPNTQHTDVTVKSLQSAVIYILNSKNQ